jgi:protein-S-isoprenylcysteine O-methyltransferase Ste14
MMRIFFVWMQLVLLVCFVGSFVGRSLYLYVAYKINVFRMSQGKTLFQRGLEWGFFLGLMLWGMEIVMVSLRTLGFSVSLLPVAVHQMLLDSLIASIFGAILMISGLAIFWWALYSFGISWRIGIDDQEPGVLVTSGAFAFSRNPIFVFIDLYFLGIFLLNGTLFFGVFALLVIGGIHYQILQEEKFLMQHYGADYQSYCARTFRYLPRMNWGIFLRGIR